MTITPLGATAAQEPTLPAIVPDAPQSASSADTDAATLGFGSLVNALGAGAQGLERAQNAENAFISGSGGLQEMMFERAKADVIVQLATAASSRVTQAITSLTQMQL